jgi:hypothetical protein
VADRDQIRFPRSARFGHVHHQGCHVATVGELGQLEIHQAQKPFGDWHLGVRCGALSAVLKKSLGRPESNPGKSLKIFGIDHYLAGNARSWVFDVKLAVALSLN